MFKFMSKTFIKNEIYIKTESNEVEKKSKMLVQKSWT